MKITIHEKKKRISYFTGKKRADRESRKHPLLFSAKCTFAKFVRVLCNLVSQPRKVELL